MQLYRLINLDVATWKTELIEAIVQMKSKKAVDDFLRGGTEQKKMKDFDGDCISFMIKNPDNYEVTLISRNTVRESEALIMSRVKGD